MLRLATRSIVFGTWVTVIGLGVGGCPGTGGELLSLLPSVDEIADYNRAYQEAQDQLDSGTPLAVRIENQTGAAVQVMLSAAVEGPPPPLGDYDYPEAMGGYPLVSATRVVFVAAGGTATGDIPCGTTVAVSALAPLDAVPLPTDLDFDYSGFYIQSGNIELAGLETAAAAGFTGDVLGDASRTLDLAQLGAVCGTHTLVITIVTPGTPSVYDPQTGALVVAAAPGGGTLALE